MKNSKKEKIKEEINVGANLYTSLKKNNTAVYAISFFATAIVLGAFALVYMIYSDAKNNTYFIDDKGTLVEASLIDNKKDEIIQVKANIEYFVNLYYSLDAYNMKDKRERVFWLVGKQPTQIIKDRENKGYFDTFLSINGLKQNAYILQNTLSVTNKDPYTANFVVRIERINGDVIQYYNSKVTMVLEKVNRNYPFNPYGLLITSFTEELTSLQNVSKEDLLKELEQSNQVINQNTPKNGE